MNMKKKKEKKTHPTSTGPRLAGWFIRALSTDVGHWLLRGDRAGVQILAATFLHLREGASSSLAHPQEAEAPRGLRGGGGAARAAAPRPHARPITPQMQGPEGRAEDPMAPQVPVFPLAPRHIEEV